MASMENKSNKSSKSKGKMTSKAQRFASLDGLDEYEKDDIHSSLNNILVAMDVVEAKKVKNRPITRLDQSDIDDNLQNSSTSSSPGPGDHDLLRLSSAIRHHHWDWKLAGCCANSIYKSRTAWKMTGSSQQAHTQTSCWAWSRSSSTRSESTSNLTRFRGLPIPKARMDKVTTIQVFITSTSWWLIQSVGSQQRRQQAPSQYWEPTSDEAAAAEARNNEAAMDAFGTEAMDASGTEAMEE